MSLNTLREKLSTLEFKALESNLDGEFLTLIQNAKKDLAALIEADDAKKAAKDWTKGEGNIYCRRPDGATGLETVTAYRNNNFPGLFISRGIDKDGNPQKHWTINHERSGLLILGGYSTMKKAALTVEKHFTGLSWDIDAGKINEYPELKEAYQAAKEAA